MKTVPILAITNALALALAIFVYVKQGETQTASRRAAERVARPRRARGLEHGTSVLAMRTMGDLPARPRARRRRAPRSSVEGETPALGPAPDRGTRASGETATRRRWTSSEEGQEGQLNGEEDQGRIFERIDKPEAEQDRALNAGEGEIATTVPYAAPDVWRRVAEGGTMENVSAICGHRPRGVRALAPGATVARVHARRGREDLRTRPCGSNERGGRLRRHPPVPPHPPARRDDPAPPHGDLLITQAEHALHAGRLAAALRDVPEPREAMIRAVALHDAGWPLLDDQPEPLPDGRAPHVFDHDTAYSAPAWRRCVAVARASGPLEALLVSRHFCGSAPVRRQQAALCRMAARPPEVEEEGVRLVRYW
jgi:hypothetical protein